MTAAPPVGIGIVGYGLMGRAHTYGYRLAPVTRSLPCVPHLRIMSGRDAEAVARAGVEYAVEETTTDWRRVVEHDDVQIVDVCTPPGTHAEIVAAALANGKAVLCEKPLATDYAAAASTAQAAAAAGLPNAIGFNYRWLPAIALAKRFVDEGRLGEVLLWRGVWLSDEFLDPTIPFDWRFERGLGGSTIADLGAHLVDLALWMVGPIEETCAQSATFTQERSGRPVEIDDASAALIRFAGGARGTLELGKVSARRPCDFFVEINGTEGTLRFDYPRLNELWYGDAREPGELYGMHLIRAEHPSHPLAADWWPIGQGIGYGETFVNQAVAHLERWPNGPWDPDLLQGARVQCVCDAIERSAAERRWVRIAEIEAG